VRKYSTWLYGCHITCDSREDFIHALQSGQGVNLLHLYLKWLIAAVAMDVIYSMVKCFA